jgi:hypothetical protein
MTIHERAHARHNRHEIRIFLLSRRHAALGGGTLHRFDPLDRAHAGQHRHVHHVERTIRRQELLYQLVKVVERR